MGGANAMDDGNGAHEYCSTFREVQAWLKKDFSGDSSVDSDGIDGDCGGDGDGGRGGVDGAGDGAAGGASVGAGGDSETDCGEDEEDERDIPASARGVDYGNDIEDEDEDEEWQREMAASLRASSEADEADELWESVRVKLDAVRLT